LPASLETSNGTTAIGNAPSVPPVISMVNAALPAVDTAQRKITNREIIDRFITFTGFLTQA
jgi:hypothetical protein